ncbi:hypothetical protein DFJ73DRAFT_902039 [Zopfochytrium polystomum]|nr:hypothetical protein DFJ73DRAFT_902039 [Zopfochytrium polystomum]
MTRIRSCTATATATATPSTGSAKAGGGCSSTSQDSSSCSSFPPTVSTALNCNTPTVSNGFSVFLAASSTPTAPRQTRLAQSPPSQQRILVITSTDDGCVLRITRTARAAARLVSLSPDPRHRAQNLLVTTTATTTTTTKNRSRNVGSAGATTPLAAMTTAVALGPAARAVLSAPNAGGDSLLSEAFSAEVLARTLFGGARMLATEMEVRYFPAGGSMMDYVLAVPSPEGATQEDECAVAVSVTRGFAHGPPPQQFTLADATRLLRKKLCGVVFAARNMYHPAFERVAKHVLHVFVRDGRAAKLCRLAWSRLRKEGCGVAGEDEDWIRARTLVVVTVCRDEWLRLDVKKKLCKLRLIISPYSYNKFDDEFNLEVAKRDPYAFLRQLFLFPSHQPGNGFAEYKTSRRGGGWRAIWRRASCGRRRRSRARPNQIFDCQRHFRDDYEGTLICDPRPAPVFVGQEDAELGVLSFLLGSDGKPLGRPVGKEEEGAVV